VTEGNIDATTLRDMLERGERVAVVDVRKGDDHAEWSITGSLNFDAYDALNAGDERAMQGLELPEGVPVVTVCGRGRSSTVAAEQLRRKGYEAYSLEGGMQAWSLAWNTAEVPVPGASAEVVQVRRTGKGCLSYVARSDGEAVVVDASLEPEVYLWLAEGRSWRITGVLDTHVHADHLSRSGRLAELVGATLHMPEGSPVSYPFSALGDGDALEVGSATLEAVRTPGHTPERTSYLLDGRALFTWTRCSCRRWADPTSTPRRKAPARRRAISTDPCDDSSSSSPRLWSCRDTRASPSRSTGSLSARRCLRCARRHRSCARTRTPSWKG
jgi:rhodanese-related sulfurtransferase